MSTAVQSSAFFSLPFFLLGVKRLVGWRGSELSGRLFPFQLVGLLSSLSPLSLRLVSEASISLGDPTPAGFSFLSPVQSRKTSRVAIDLPLGGGRKHSDCHTHHTHHTTLHRQYPHNDGTYGLLYLEACTPVESAEPPDALFLFGEGTARRGRGRCCIVKLGSLRRVRRKERHGSTNKARALRSGCCDLILLSICIPRSSSPTPSVFSRGAPTTPRATPTGVTADPTCDRVLDDFGLIPAHARAFVFARLSLTRHERRARGNVADGRAALGRPVAVLGCGGTLRATIVVGASGGGRRNVRMRCCRIEVDRPPWQLHASA